MRYNLVDEKTIYNGRKVRLDLYIYLEQHEALKKLVKETGAPQSYLIRKAIQNLIESKNA